MRTVLFVLKVIWWGLRIFGRALAALGYDGDGPILDGPDPAFPAWHVTPVPHQALLAAKARLDEAEREVAKAEEGRKKAMKAYADAVSVRLAEIDAAGSATRELERKHEEERDTLLGELTRVVSLEEVERRIEEAPITQAQSVQTAT